MWITPTAMDGVSHAYITLIKIGMPRYVSVDKIIILIADDYYSNLNLSFLVLICFFVIHIDCVVTWIHKTKITCKKPQYLHFMWQSSLVLVSMSVVITLYAALFHTPPAVSVRAVRPLSSFIIPLNTGILLIQPHPNEGKSAPMLPFTHPSSCNKVDWWTEIRRRLFNNIIWNLALAIMYLQHSCC